MNLTTEEEINLQEIYKAVGIDSKYWQQINNAPSDTRVELLDFVESIEMIHWMLQSDDKRGYARDRPRDSKGRIIVDITKPHVLEDMDYFRQSAIHFQKYGKYTNFYPNPHPKSEYKKFWDEETRRCIEGYVRESDGEWVSGYYYWYLNYFPIMRTEATGEGKRAERIYDFVDVWDSDYLFYHYVEQGESESEYGSVLKTRGRGYSFKISSMLDRNFYLIKKSKGYAFASVSEYLTKDGVLTKAWSGMDFLDENTPWSKLKQKKNTDGHKRASYIHPITGKESGYMSEIMEVTTKGDAEKGRGKRGKLLIHEEAGIYPKLLQTWNIARPSIEDGDFTFGYQICFGTGGSPGSKFEGLEELFYRGGGYKVKMVRNVWDKVKGEGTCGFFVPEYMNRKGCYDENGNSNVAKALIEMLINRKKIRENASKENALTQEKAERPCISKNTIVSNTSIGSNKITLFDKYFINGHHELFELNTKYGRKLECTFDHEIFDGENYQKAGKYDIGDRIKLKEFIPNDKYVEITIQGDLALQKYNIKIDEDFARFLGLYMGDGSFYNNTIEFTFDNRDKESIDWLIEYSNKIFKYPVKEISQNGNMVKVSINSIELKNIFIQLDLLKKWNGNKHGYKRKIHVPLYIFQSPKSVIAAFLQGYFDADSGIYNGQKNIKLYAKEKIILEQVQILLSVFDIFCEIKSEIKINGEGREYKGNSIVLRSWEVDNFKKIGYISKRKQNLLDKWTEYKSKIKDNNYGYDFIDSFNSIGIQEVYDIQTEEGCYSANGIWAHNCTPQEAVMRIEGSLFPVDDLKSYLETIMPEMGKFVSKHYIGKLNPDPSSGVLSYSPSADDKVIREFPLKDNVNKYGAIEIFKMPVTDGMGVIPRFRYYAGIDTYDDDSSTTNSLGSIFIADILTDEIVAEFTGRPKTANEFYEICLRLLKFYNAIANYENDKKGIFAYFSHRNMLSYLAPNPQILKDMEMVKATNLYGNKSLGTNSGVKINAWGRRLQADWMLEPAYGEEKKGLLNLHMIRSIGYLKESIAWNEDGNFDRVSAMGMLMILREEYKKYKLQVSEQALGTKIKNLANDTFFDLNYGLKDKIDPKIVKAFGANSYNILAEYH
jgi:hypothetical protein